MRIEKQLKGLIKVCEKYGPSSKSPDHVAQVKVELELALANVMATKEDYEFQADTEYYWEVVAS